MHTKPPVFIGIDPGAKGAVCVLLPSEQKAIFVNTDDAPVKILKFLKTVAESYDVRVIMIERVHSVPQSTAKSNFTFGRNLGTIETVAAITELMVDTVPPKKWQKHIGLVVKPKLTAPERKKAIKHGVAAIAERLYPKVNIRGPQGGLLDGKSDALMIAHYASQTHLIIE